MRLPWSRPMPGSHGAGALRAKALVAEADGFAVAAIEEALALADGGITAPILLLEGVFEANELAEVEAHDLWMVVHPSSSCKCSKRTPRKTLQRLAQAQYRHEPGRLRARLARIKDRQPAAGRQAYLMTHFARATSRTATRPRSSSRASGPGGGIAPSTASCNSAILSLAGGARAIKGRQASCSMAPIRCRSTAGGWGPM